MCAEVLPWLWEFSNFSLGKSRYWRALRSTIYVLHIKKILHFIGEEDVNRRKEYANEPFFSYHFDLCGPYRECLCLHNGGSVWTAKPTEEGKNLMDYLESPYFSRKMVGILLRSVPFFRDFIELNLFHNPIKGQICDGHFRFSNRYFLKENLISAYNRRLKTDYQVIWYMDDIMNNLLQWCDDLGYIKKAILDGSSSFVIDKEKIEHDLALEILKRSGRNLKVLLHKDFMKYHPELRRKPNACP